MTSQKRSPNGFKFSFKDSDANGTETPKFVSIELPAKSLTIENETAYQASPKNNSAVTKIQFGSSHLLTSVFKPKYYTSHHYLHEKREQKQQLKIQVSTSKRRVIHSYDNKKKIVENVKTEMSRSNKNFISHIDKKMKIFERKESSKSSIRSNESNTEQLSSSYLEIFRKEKKKMRKNEKQNELTVLKFYEFKSEESPKSIASSNSKPRKFIFPNSDHKKNRLDLLDLDNAPQTTKNAKFTENGYNKFFKDVGFTARNNKKNELKSNRMARALFKGQVKKIQQQNQILNTRFAKLRIKTDNQS